MDPSLPLTTTEQLEWGNPILDEKIHSLIKNYSPYENLSSSTMKSTDIWITAGLEDERIPIWQSLKYVKKLRELSKNSSGQNLVLYLPNHRGHQYESHIGQEIHETSLELSFLINSFENID